MSSGVSRLTGLKSLGVGDDQLGTLAARAARAAVSSLLLDHYVDAAGVQDVPNGLLLGQDEPSLGGGGVDGSDENHHVTGVDQISHQMFGVLAERRPGGRCALSARGCSGRSWR